MTVGKSRSRSWHRATAWANTRGRNVLTRRTAPFAPENMRSLWPLPFHEGCERRGEESGERHAPALVRFRRVPHELAADLSTASVTLSSRTAPNWAVGVDGSGRCWMCVGMPTSRSTRAPVEPEIEGEGLKLVEPRTGMALVLMPRLAREAQPAAEPNRLVLRWTGAGTPPARGHGRLATTERAANEVKISSPLPAAMDAAIADGECRVQR